MYIPYNFFGSDNLYTQKQFLIFTEVATSKSLSDAAEKLSLSQPALSKYIKKLENDIGVELFDRSTNPISLTKAGELFLNFSYKSLDICKQFEKELGDIKKSTSDTICLGISPSRAPYLLPEILSDYINKHPSVTLKILEEQTDILNEKLKNGELDLLISVLEQGTEQFEKIELFDESILLAVPFNAPDDYNSLIKQYPMVIPEKGQIIFNGFEDTFLNYFSNIRKITCKNQATALSFVEAGVAITFLPSYMRDYSSSNKIKYLTIKDIDSTRKVCAFYRNSQFLSNSESELISSVADKFKLKENKKNAN